MTDTSSMRLNLGSGPHATPGWICIDRSPNILLSRAPALKAVLLRAGLLNDAHMAPWDPEVVRADIRSLPYDDGSVSAIYSSHTLEHIYINEAKQVLRESARVLRSGGMIRLALPDAAAMAKRFAESPDAETSRWYNNELRAQPDEPARGLRALIGKAGGHIHRWQPTSAMTSEMLEEAGFVDIHETEFQQGDFPDLAIIETRPESFFLEARKP